MGGQIVVVNRVVRVGLIEEERFEGGLGSLPNISGRGDFQAEKRARTKDPRREPSSHMTSVFKEEEEASVAGVGQGKGVAEVKVQGE